MSTFFCFRRFKESLELWFEDPSPFWNSRKKKFKVMSRVYRHYGCIKAGSCGSERQNSLAGHLQGGRKWNKDPKTLRALVLQHLWSFWDIAEIMMWIFEACFESFPHFFVKSIFNHILQLFVCVYIFWSKFDFAILSGNCNIYNTQFIFWDKFS